MVALETTSGRLAHQICKVEICPCLIFFSFALWALTALRIIIFSNYVEGYIFEFIKSPQLVEKLRCILPLSNLFSSLARRFACCQSCSVSAPFGLTALTPLRGVLLKNRRWVKVNLEVSSQLEFSLKINYGLMV